MTLKGNYASKSVICDLGAISLYSSVQNTAIRVIFITAYRQNGSYLMTLSNYCSSLQPSFSAVAELLL